MHHSLARVLSLPLPFAVVCCFAAALLFLPPAPRLCAQVQALPAGAQAEADSIDPERLRASVKTLASWIQHGEADTLLASVGMTADQAIEASNRRGFKAVSLPVRLQATIHSRIRMFDSANVMAKVSGTQPGGAVLYTGHWDHFGINRTRKGDPVFHGAADNATGSAIVMELARVQADTYIVERYHTPNDRYEDSMDFRGNARMARFGFELGWHVLQQSAPVEWLGGDEFERARKRSEGQ